MEAPVFVTGVGVISAIGNNTTECLAAFEKEEAGMAEIKLVETIHRGKLPVAEVKRSNEELADECRVSAQISRTALLSLTAAKEAIDDAGLDTSSPLRIGFISANTVGGMDKTENFYNDFHLDNQKGRLRNVVNHECGSITQLVANKIGITNYVTTINTACSSSANSIFFGARLIRQNILDVVIAGGTDAITRFTINGFNTLMILDHQNCKPFDEERKGLNLGEGAGYVVLMSEQVMSELKCKPYCLLSGYANANDAYHQTASSPEGNGSYTAMQEALRRSGLQPQDISYINLHGTGTQNNDIAEGTAIKRLFDPVYPKMSSTKSFTGHSLGASGGMEAVFSAVSVRESIIYPNLRFNTRMKELPFEPVTKFTKGSEVKHVLSNSFGFGGNCSSLIFSKV